MYVIILVIIWVSVEIFKFQGVTVLFEFFRKLWDWIIVATEENVIGAIKDIGFKDIIDILVLAAVLYFLVRFAKKRRATKLVMGLVLFLLITFIGDAINLTALKLVFGDFRQLGVIAILIIFQPEFRSALEKIGGTTFNSLQNINHADKKGENANYVIESVSRAAQRMSSIGHGALIVIERSSSLSEFKNSGTTLDAVVSPDLLCSIFYKGGALHDGAVIIRNGKVDTAACVLRMTDRADIDSELGTRHRAAIGTTEVSDAVVVVVSEETGTISLSIDGNLERGFNYTSLRNRLTQILIPETKDKRGKGKGKGSRKKNSNHNQPNTEE